MAAAVAGLRRAVAAALGLLKARRAARLRGAADARVRVSWSHRRLGGVVRLACELEAPPHRAPEAAAAVAAAVAEVAAALGVTVGSVGIVPGEEPRLVALAPRRDLIAPALLESLAPHPGHPPTHLWLALAPGTYLASVVDPFRPFAPGDGPVAGLVLSGAARCALLAERSLSVAGLGLRLVVYCPAGGVGPLLGSVRAGLAGRRDGIAAR